MLKDLWELFVVYQWNEGFFGKIAAVCSVVLFVVYPLLMVYDTYFTN